MASVSNETTCPYFVERLEGWYDPQITNLGFLRDEAEKFLAKRTALTANHFGHRNIPLTEAELIVIDDLIYHLKLDQTAPNIIFVGDPERAKFICNEYMALESAPSEHRGLFAGTGICNSTGQRVSVLTSGMGTGSQEITLVEALILNHYDLKTRLPKPTYPEMHIIRVGTTGGLQDYLQVGSAAISEYTVGFDGSGFAYKLEYPDRYCPLLKTHMDAVILNGQNIDDPNYGEWKTYVTRSNPMVVNALQSSFVGQSFVGITGTHGGFFGSQGRDVLAVPPAVDKMTERVAAFNSPFGMQMTNFEMEGALINGVCAMHGVRSGAICVVVADRKRDSAVNSHQAIKEGMHQAILATFKAHEILGKQRGDTLIHTLKS